MVSPSDGIVTRQTTAIQQVMNAAACPGLFFGFYDRKFILAFSEN
jgi:hypothetical protein